MRLFFLTITTVALVASTTATMAQVRGAVAPMTAAQPAAGVSEAQAAMDRAAASGKYALLFFWRDKTEQTDKAWKTLEPAAAKLAKSADVISIQITNPAEKRIVDRYGVSRAPMPMVLAISPCGAITKGFNKGFDEAQIRDAFVSPCTERCMKALQSRKLVFACVVDQGQAVAPQGVQDFKADEKYSRATEIVLISASDKAEAEFLKELEVDPNGPKPVAVFMAPPGVMIGKFDGQATKGQIMAKLASAQQGCCPGGKCGPGGCGPKK
jgi:hypothetical protein